MIERMQDIVPYLENIESIELQDRQDLPDGRLFIVRRWQGSASTVPSALRAFVSRDLLGWIDTATWVPSEYRVDWVHSMCSARAARLYECSGTNYFEPDPLNANRTRIRITGELIVHPDRVPGIPRFLAGRLAPQIESFVIGLITPNLVGLSRGLQRYFDARRGRKKRPARRSTGS
jgi:hypothetical protein